MSTDVAAWRAVILASSSRAKARKQLKCTFKELKDFRAQHMPDHQWPGPSAPEQGDAEDIHEASPKWVRARMFSPAEYLAELSAVPTPEEAAEAAAQLPHDLAKALLEFVPGMRTRAMANEYFRLAERKLIYKISLFQMRHADGYAFTGLGRAVHSLLKEVQ